MYTYIKLNSPGGKLPALNNFTSTQYFDSEYNYLYTISLNLFGYLNETSLNVL